MKPQRQILVSVGILVDTDSDTGNDPTVEAVSHALRDASYAVARQFPLCEAAGVVNLDYLGHNGWNATRCEGCGDWATDAAKESQVGCIALGHWIDGQFFCTQCRAPPGVKNP